MSKREFIRQNRKEIDKIIRSGNGCSNIGSLNDSDREDWIMNVEYLYDWARREGVPL